jgi:hypothetical protein
MKIRDRAILRGHMVSLKHMTLCHVQLQWAV